MVQIDVNKLSNSLAKTLIHHQNLDILGYIFEGEDYDNFLQSLKYTVAIIVFEGKCTDEYRGQYTRLVKDLHEKLSNFSQEELEKIWFLTG